MTTSEFIKMLQEEDPEGTAHIRMDGGVPYCAQHKPGYYDGPYSYIDKDGKYVQTSQGSKVDIYCKTSSEYVWDNEMNWNSFQEDPEIAWERLKLLFVFDYNNYSDPKQRQERIDSFFKNLRTEFDEYITHSITSNGKYLNEVIDKYKKGWRFFQKKEFKYKFYDWTILTPSGKNDGANWATTGPIVLSGKFEPILIGEHTEWILKGDSKDRTIPKEIKELAEIQVPKKSWWKNYLCWKIRRN